MDKKNSTCVCVCVLWIPATNESNDKEKGVDTEADSEYPLLLLLLKGVGGERGRTNEKSSPRVSYDVIYLATLGLPLVCLRRR